MGNPSRSELEHHFGVSGKDVGDEEPVIPGRKRRVASACVCILGEAAARLLTRARPATCNVCSVSPQQPPSAPR